MFIERLENGKQKKEMYFDLFSYSWETFKHEMFPERKKIEKHKMNKNVQKNAKNMHPVCILRIMSIYSTMTKILRLLLLLLSSSSSPLLLSASNIQKLYSVHNVWCCLVCILCSTRCGVQCSLAIYQPYIYIVDI